MRSQYPRYQDRANLGLVGIVGIILMVLGSISILAQEYSLDEARKVYALIDHVENSQGGSDRPDGRHVVTMESELNSYIAYRIETEKEDMMKALKFKMLEKNKIEGWLYFDLREQNLPKILRPEMNFYFRGVIETSRGAVRLNLDKLFLEGQEISPMLLDLVFGVVARLNKVESSSINDWYELPYGIQEIKVHEGRAEFFY